MTKEVYYVYLGTNGTITSPVHLEDIYYVRQYKLTADTDKYLTKDGVKLVKRATAYEDDLEDWYEVDA